MYSMTYRSVLSPLRLVFLALALSALAACDNAEERAEAHFQSALELISKGDLDRAYVEFRSVFKLNGEHPRHERPTRLCSANPAIIERRLANICAWLNNILTISTATVPWRKCMPKLAHGTK